MGRAAASLVLKSTFQHTFSELLPEDYGDLSVYATYTYTDSNVELTETFNSSTFGLDGQSDHCRKPDPELLPESVWGAGFLPLQVGLHTPTTTGTRVHHQSG